MVSRRIHTIDKKSNSRHRPRHSDSAGHFDLRFIGFRTRRQSMRYLTFGALVCLLVGAGARVQAQDAQVIAPIKQFMDAFNKGDMAAAAATHTSDADLAIVDEVPPFAWRGAQAFKAWSAALDADAKKQGMTEPAVSISAPTRTELDGDNAYVIVPAVFTYKLKGVPM